MRGKPSAIREAAIFGIILTIRSNMLQNEAVTCYFEGKHCIQCIAALRYFRYSESKELGITIFVSSALLLPALLHRTDNTPPPSCQSGSRARRTSSRVGLFSFPASLFSPKSNRSIANTGNAAFAVVPGPFDLVGAGAFEFEAHRLALVPALEFLAEAVGVDPPLAGIAWLDIAAETDRLAESTLPEERKISGSSPPSGVER
nr:hypothetical protein [Rhizobium leguminosarum]